MELPPIGFGTYPLDDAEAEAAVRDALELGYRLIDTAAAYGNETGVGRGIASGGPAIVTTKLRGADQGYEPAKRAFEASRERLQVDVVDVYLIHWPLPRLDRYVDTWRAFIELRDEGAIRAIGVSNFTAAQLDRLERETGVMPAVNQIELHPYFNQERMRAENARRGVATQAWSPLGRGSALLGEAAITGAAARHGVTPGQAVLRWHVQLGVIPLPKSASHERRRENLDIFGFALDDAEMAAIGALPQQRTGGDPDTHEEF